MIRKTILNYLLLLICAAVVFAAAVVFRGNGFIYLIVPVLQILLSWFNCHYSNKWQMVLILHIHLLISTVLGVFLEGYLYCNYVYDDAETRILILLMLMVGSGLVVALGTLTTWIKYSLTKK